MYEAFLETVWKMNNNKKKQKTKTLWLPEIHLHQSAHKTALNQRLNE